MRKVLSGIGVYVMAIVLIVSAIVDFIFGMDGEEETER